MQIEYHLEKITNIWYSLQWYVMGLEVRIISNIEFSAISKTKKIKYHLGKIISIWSPSPSVAPKGVGCKSYYQYWVQRLLKPTDQKPILAMRRIREQIGKRAIRLAPSILRIGTSDDGKKCYTSDVQHDARSVTKIFVTLAGVGSDASSTATSVLQICKTW